MENTNLTRKQQKIFAGNTTISEEQIAVFGSKAQTRIMQFSLDPDVIQSENWGKGWQNATILEEAPFEEDFNAISYVNTYNMAYLLQKGIPEYNENTTYYKGSIAMLIDEDGKPTLYYSKTDSNLNHNPSTDTTNWEELKFGNGGNNLLDFKFTDHLLNDQSWLRSDTFSWQDGTVYSDIYNHLVEDYSNATIDKKQYAGSNVTKYGSVKDINGVISNFNLTNHATLTLPSALGTDPWEVVLKVKFDVANEDEDIFAHSNPSDCQGLVFIKSNKNKLLLYASSNGTSWNIANLASGSTIFNNTNQFYYFKLEFTGSQYLVSYSIDGQTWIPEITVNSTTPVWHNDNTVYNIGWFNVYPERYLKGQIDLNESYININGERVWDGVKTLDYKVAADGHKIIPASDTANLNILEELYANTGIAWYYILDTENQQFKLPRSQWNFVGLRPNSNVGDYVEESLPNITSEAIPTSATADTIQANFTGAFYELTTGQKGSLSNDYSTNTNYGLGFDASRSSSAYQDGALVQQRATEMYLYFYVGKFTQTATEQTAGINTETLNGKADTDLSNLTSVGKSYITSLTPPSNISIDLSYPGYGNDIVAADDGYLNLQTTSSSNPGESYAQLYSKNKAYSISSYASNEVASAILMPVSKGETITCYHHGNIVVFKFIYPISKTN